MDIQTGVSRKYSYNASTPSLGTTSVTTSLSLSDCTATTSSTVPGLGEISGRAILALGKVTLRGAEYVIIRRRLDTISVKFPHRNTGRILGIDQMYKDVLELSRCDPAKFSFTSQTYPSNRRDLYHDTVRIRALSIILVQIGSRQTQKLVEHLLGWPLIEIKIFISEFTAMLDPLKCVGTLCTIMFLSINYIPDYIRRKQQGNFLFRYKRILDLLRHGKAIPWSHLSSSCSA